MSIPPKYAEFFTPEKRAEHARIRAEVAATYPDLKKKSRDQHEAKMREGRAPHLAVGVMRIERRRQHLSDEEMMARSGLDAAALASMYGRDAQPSIETMEAFARGLGKKLLIVLADDDSSAESQPLHRSPDIAP